MRLDPIEVYILECFRQREATSLTFDEIFAESTSHRRDALRDALVELERAQVLVRRSSHGNRFDLTAEGRRFLDV
ncbi:MAG TPA: hypothetical protein VKH35_04660 [Thermoanaerobaculia bacterium]|jgi:hypothetical protein|nr:hypothetical protein [Thermoanaerobaculia bacterium]